MKMRRLLSRRIVESDVSNFEEFVGEALPVDYRDFLLDLNGGVPELPYFLLHGGRGGYADSVVRHFFGISEKIDIDLSYNFKIYVAAKRIPLNMLPIAADPGGNIILLGIGGGEKGKVFFWNHEMEGLGTESSELCNLVFVANSFTDFINNLQAEPHD